MDNLQPQYYIYQSKILRLKNEEKIMIYKMHHSKQKRKLLNEKKYILINNIKMLQSEQSRYKKLKLSYQKDNQRDNIIYYLFSICLINISSIKFIFIILFILNIINDIWKENITNIDNKINKITSELVKKQQEIEKTLEKIKKISDDIKKIERCIKENKFEQKIYYLNYLNYLNSNKNKEQENKFQKQLTIN